MVDDNVLVDRRTEGKSEESGKLLRGKFDNQEGHHDYSDNTQEIMGGLTIFPENFQFFLKPWVDGYYGRNGFITHESNRS